MRRRGRDILIGFAVVAIFVTSYASPYWTLREMRNAILEKDADAFSSRVDFPALRESVRAQVMVAMQARLDTPETKGNALAGFGMLLGMALINQIIDTMVTPAGVMTLMAEGTSKPLDLIPGRALSPRGQLVPGASSAPASTPAPLLAPAPSGGTSAGVGEGADTQTGTIPRNDYTVQYKNWSAFTATARQAGQPPVSFLFRRDGLWSWKLAGVTLPLAAGQ